MAQIQPKIEIMINPSRPTQEILDVISAVCVYHPGNEAKVLEGIQVAIGKRLIELDKIKEEQSAN